MDLPFKTQPKPETHTVGTATSGTLELPKLYTVTPNEEVAISESLRKAGSGNDVPALNRCKSEIAALALKRIWEPPLSETDPKPPTAEDMAELPLALVGGLFDYLLAERRAWKKPEPADDSDPKSTGASTSKDSEAPSPTTTTDLAPAGQTATTTTASATSRSPKSGKATKPTSK
ncbi:MAG: hypothetical protein AAF609_05335 [Cyanobacteria bacterium P01_C01_bin.120]